MLRQGKTLGHIVSKNGICMNEEKFKVIVNMPKPENAREEQAFMGQCGYYQRFIFQYAYIDQPLYALIVAYDWKDECKQSFQKLRHTLMEAPILREPNWNKVFHVHSDASNLQLDA